MLYPRIIPCLLIHNKGLVKTVNFKNPKYVGDPLNAVKIFNEKQVDELMVVDIDATVNGNEPDYKLIKDMAVECRMPFCYGGGIKTPEQARKIFNLGVEKIAISSIAVQNQQVVKAIANQVGNQSVVVVLDVRKKSFSNKYEVFIRNGKENTGLDPFDFAAEIVKAGAGEIIINSIDNDGVMKGYDMKLIDRMRKVVDTPVTVLGGAGSLSDISDVIKRHNIIGAAAGSLFVFKGKYRAVLINYPNSVEKERLIHDALRPEN